MRLVYLAFFLTLISLPWQHAYGSQTIEVSHFEDTTSEITASEIAEQRFVPLENGLSKGYTSSTQWFRLEIGAEQAASNDTYVRIRPSFLDDVSLFRVQDEQLHLWQEIGDKADPKTQTVDLGLLGFTWPKDDRVIYVRVASEGSIQVTFVADSMDEVRLQAQNILSVQSLYVGFLVFLMVLALVYFVYERNWLFVMFFLSQALYLGVFVLLSEGFVGFALRYLPVPRGLYSDFVVPLATAAAIGFHYALFSALKVTRGPKRLLEVMLGFCATAFVLVLFGQIRIGLQVNAISVMFAPLAYIWAVICSRPATTRDKVYYLVVYTVLGVSIMLWMLPMIGAAKPNFFSQNSLLVYGILTSVLIFLVLSRYQHSLRRELEEVSIALNLERERAVQIQQKKQATKQLVDLVAHEIRTASSVITMNLPIEILGAKKVDRCKRALASISLLIDRLIATEEMDQWDQNLKLEPIKVAVLLQEAVQRVGLSDRIRLEVPEDITCQSNYFYLLVVLENILDNALKYSEPNSVVDVRVTALEGGCLISVINRVDSSLILDSQRIFERYYRSKRHSAIRGSGVGLYLVQTIVEKMAGSVVANQSANEVEFKIWLPAS